MAKNPDSPLVLAEEFATDVKAIYGDDLVSVILYGNAASGAWLAKKSDINILIIVSEIGISRLNAGFALVEKWRKHTRALPLFMTKQYISASLDSFPIEFLQMKRHHKVILGEDVLAPLEIPHENLRLKCEEQIKGKLLHLRQEYLATLGKRHRLQELIEVTLPAFAVLFKALLFLKGVEVPDGQRDIILLTAELYGLDQDLFQQVIQAGDKKNKMTHVELNRIAAAYIAEINKLALIIDQMQ
jgi:hypothetical protein